MNKVKLGNTDIELQPIVFGGNVFGWTADEKTSFQLLDAFIDGGFSVIDTANQYSHWVPGHIGGESETIIGNWLKRSGKRNQVSIATKVGGIMAGTPEPNTTKAYILREVENSLRRLQIETIDLYQTHFDNEATAVEETLEAYDELIRGGKVRWIGASNLSPERLKQSLAASLRNGFPKYQTLQPEYNLYNRAKYEREYEPIAVEDQLGVVTYYSLASGFLTGKYRSDEDLNKSVRGAAVRKMLDDRGKNILAALDQVAEEYRTTPAGLPNHFQRMRIHFSDACLFLPLKDCFDSGQQFSVKGRI